MYHARFSGSHYEIGFRWGSQLAKHANYILNNIPFPIILYSIVASILVYRFAPKTFKIRT